MKLLTIDDGAQGHPAILFGTDVIDLARLARTFPTAQLVSHSVRALLEAGDAGMEAARSCLRHVEALPEAARRLLREQKVLRPFEGLALLCPIPEPRLVLSAAANYGKHVKEFSAVPMPKVPTAFIKTGDSLSGHGAGITIPAQCPDRVDFEGEFCFVFGRTCHNVEESEAMSYVAGYTIANDVSARNWVPEVFAADERWAGIRAWERNVMGKNLPGFTPCGPFLVTADEIADPHDLRLVTRLNGEVMQDGTTADLLFNLPQLISYFSKWYRFHPGDIVTTGSPAGIGASRKPPVFMREGDLIEVEIAGLGKLSNRLVSAA